jgi:hypothetical protein
MDLVEVPEREDLISLVEELEKIYRKDMPEDLEENNF